MGLNFYECPTHGKQECVFNFNNKLFCVACIGELLEKYIAPLHSAEKPESKEEETKKYLEETGKPRL